MCFICVYVYKNNIYIHLYNIYMSQQSLIYLWNSTEIYKVSEYGQKLVFYYNPHP